MSQRKNLIRIIDARCWILLLCVSISTKELYGEKLAGERQDTQLSTQHGQSKSGPWTLDETHSHYLRALAHREPLEPVFQSFRSYASAGSSEASAWTGICLIFGYGVKRDVSRGTALVLASSSSGNPTGMRLLARLKTAGRLVPADLPGAIVLYNKSIQEGDMASLDPLAMIYLYGPQKNADAAMKLLRRGALAGDSNAMLHLGEMYERGDLETHVSRDRAQAGDLFQKASDAENVVATAHLGKMLFWGLGCPEDRERGLSMLEIAAKANIPYAQADLASALSSGTSVDAQIKAYAWSVISARRGNKTALDTLMALSEKLSKPQVDEAVMLSRSYSSQLALVPSETRE